MKEQPNRLVNCSCCGQQGERGDFYQDKINDRYACVDIDGCVFRQKLRKAIGGLGICPSHGLAILITHVNDGEPCSDYLYADSRSKAKSE
jgi:hypothetical protein